MQPQGVSFCLWAPKVEHLAVVIHAGRERRAVQLHRGAEGFFSGIADQAQAGDNYSYLLDRKVERPDPASRYQPEGVHGPSQVVDLDAFRWSDQDWRNIPLQEYVLYELHVGTFTREGTFAAIIPKLDYLLDLGITAVELMPVAQFPGERNWGYDGVFPFAPQHSYGGPDGLRKLIDACHGKGLAVVLDVVYNHLGPEGNYLRDFGYYFTDRYRTPWGDAVNFDGPFSDHVRDYFIGNALYWVREYHVDALRLDAVHGIYDIGARHFLEELATTVHCEGKRLGKPVYVIAESDLNDVRLIKPIEEGGYGLDAQWNDDFHHSVHSLLTGEQDGYYTGFGRCHDLAKALSEGFVYSGQFSPYRRRRHGNSAQGRPARQFVVFSQNHDQVGNRMLGERLSRLVNFESLKLVAGLVLLSPYIPLLFMGEEYGEDNPFYYFVSHEDTELIAAVRAGRKEEFREFLSRGEPPDPEAVSTFQASKLAWQKYENGSHALLLAFYRHLLRLRREISTLGTGDVRDWEAGCAGDEGILWIRRHDAERELLVLFNMNERVRECRFPAEEGEWRKILDSAEETWGGSGSALDPEPGPKAAVIMEGRSCALYQRK